MTENQIATIVIDICFRIHTTMGPGLFESVYEEILCYELDKIGLAYKRQHPVPLIWQDIKMDIAFRADIIVENKVLIELKSVEKVTPVFQKQVLTYLKLGDWKLGLLINFGEFLIKNGIQRIVNKL